jgi:transaldolase
MTKIYLDGADPKETSEIIKLLGKLDGQTTNPTLVATSPLVQGLRDAQGKLGKQELWSAYKQIITDISTQLGADSSVSIEVDADMQSDAMQLVTQGRELATWTPLAHIKLPCTLAGLQAARSLTREGYRVNITLVFSLEQAAAIHVATLGAPRGSVYTSAFIGRLDDVGVDGMSLIKQVQDFYTSIDSHVELLGASVRSVDHMMACMAYGVPILTASGKTLREWANTGKQQPDAAYTYVPKGTLVTSPEPSLAKKLEEFDLRHELTEAGIQRFVNDWRQLFV